MPNISKAVTSKHRRHVVTRYEKTKSGKKVRKDYPVKHLFGRSAKPLIPQAPSQEQLLIEFEQLSTTWNTKLKFLKKDHPDRVRAKNRMDELQSLISPHHV